MIVSHKSVIYCFEREKSALSIPATKKFRSRSKMLFPQQNFVPATLPAAISIRPIKMPRFMSGPIRIALFPECTWASRFQQHFCCWKPTIGDIIRLPNRAEMAMPNFAPVLTRSVLHFLATQPPCNHPILSEPIRICVVSSFRVVDRQCQRSICTCHL